MSNPATPIPDVQRALDRLVGELHAGAEVTRVHAFSADDTGGGEATQKAIGYGRPIRFSVRHRDGSEGDLVLHTALPDDFGHDRRADRAADMLLSHDTFAGIPRHVRAIDVGRIAPDGALVSERGGGEYYLVTEFAPGAPYADDLRRLERSAALEPRDERRCDLLADYLARLHAAPGERAAQYTRSIRDVVGSGEGIFGMIDGYPDDVPSAPAARLRAIERRCADWRWRLRGRERRVARIHGDFHPFNIVFDDADELAVLDASRGCRGDPADDVCCLAINYLFFALPRPHTWRPAFGPLWSRFWGGYLAATGDRELAEVAPLHLAWRALVLANPAWYPAVTANQRDALLGLVERALEAGRFAPEQAEDVFA